jgi:hypothetical protein
MSSHPCSRNLISVLVWAIGISLLFSCAQVVAPPGGTPDRIPPKMTSSEPANGSVNVSTGDRIRITFSEPVQQGTGRQVYISPRPAKEPKLKWKSNELEVILPDTFRTGQTYIVQVSSAVSDLRSNHLDSSIIVAFSTGATLDSGRISGTVATAGAPTAGALVGLYLVNNPLDSLRYDSISPEYMTLSNAKGLFDFKYLPRKVYQLIAFTDKNRDEKFNPRLESYAVSDRPVDLRNDTSFQGLAIGMRTVDTVKPQILSGSFSANHLIKLRLTKPIRLDQLSKSQAGISLRSVSDSGVTVHPVGMLESDDTTSATLTLAFPPLSDTAYTAEVRYDSTVPAMVWPRIEIKQGTDKEKPTVVSFSPAGGKPIFAQDVRIGLIFSEPLDTSRVTQATFDLKIPPAEMSLHIRRRWRDPFHVDFVPDSLLEGKGYVLKVVDSSLTDMVGNRVGDSATIYRFSTMNPDSLGTISGQITINYKERAKDPVILTFKEVTGKFSLTRTYTQPPFRVDVPAGKYLLSGYLDSNRNGSRDLGSVWPMRFAETLSAQTDTVTVRARFETAEVQFIVK